MNRALFGFGVLVASTIMFDAPACAPVQQVSTESGAAPTVEEAQAFVKQVEAELLKLGTYLERAEWVRMTYITDDTELLAARANEEVMEYVGRKAAEATRFGKLELPFDLKRKLHLLKVSLSAPAPRDAEKRAELARISTTMDSRYGKGKYCSKRQGGKCLHLGELEEILAKSRNYDDLLDVWRGWRTISPPLRKDYQRFVELASQGARELGFESLADVWNSRYDMPPADFEAETERLWQQVKPFYEHLHCYVRAKLAQTYGKDKVPAGKPIPAHLLGNMWSQEWSNLYGLLAPDPKSASAIDLEPVLLAKKVDEQGMVKTAEAFFTSLGLDPLPKTFWERSLFVKPRDREVVCHASAWDIDSREDLRIKMCIKINGEDFTTIHHELGHNYYQLVYRHLDPLFLGSANDGFHEALGDLISLSVTPGYLKQIGLIKKLPPDNLNPLMQRALDKVAFLPWGLLVDRWRWGVFRGAIRPENYNQAWWELCRNYQGVEAPVPRSEEDFDPGAKYHIPANVPYTRYFLATFLQFQFHRALCRESGHQGPLHACSIYGKPEVGARLKKMMELGQSRPWPEALRALTGEEKMDASALIEYFEPLDSWLKEQNKGKQCGW